VRPIETTAALSSLVSRIVAGVERSLSASIPRPGRSRRSGSPSIARSRGSPPSSAARRPCCDRGPALPSSRSIRSRTAP
jgi:hypothetical protein